MFIKFIISQAEQSALTAMVNQQQQLQEIYALPTVNGYQGSKGLRQWPNNVTQNCPFCRLKLAVETLK